MTKYRVLVSLLEVTGVVRRLESVLADFESLDAARFIYEKLAEEVVSQQRRC